VACKLALERLKAVREIALCYKYNICPFCGGNLEVTVVHNNGKRDLKCNHCKNTYKEVF